MTVVGSRALLRFISMFLVVALASSALFSATPASAAQSKTLAGSASSCRMNEIGGDPVVVIVPHPDDEAFGFAGTLGAAVRAGAPVRVYLVSDGEGARLSGRWLKKHMRSVYDLNLDGRVDKYDFAAYRRAEFKKSMHAIGVPKESAVYLGNAYHDSPLPLCSDAQILAEFIEQDCRREKFPLGERTRVFTVAPRLDDTEAGLFYGEEYRKRREHPTHRLCADAAVALFDREAPLHAEKVYFFKVYAHGISKKLPDAPRIFTATTREEFAVRKQSIRAYRSIGKKSAPHIYRQSLRQKREYAATLQDLIKAGYLPR